MDKLLTRCHVSWNLELIRKNRLLEVRVREVLIFWVLNHHGIDCLVAIFKILFKKELAGYIVLIFTKIIEGESNRKRNSWAVNSDDYIIVCHLRLKHLGFVYMTHKRASQLELHISSPLILIGESILTSSPLLVYCCLWSEEKEKEGWMLCCQEWADSLNTSAFSANGLLTLLWAPGLCRF